MSAATSPERPGLAAGEDLLYGLHSFDRLGWSDNVAQDRRRATQATKLRRVCRRCHDRVTSELPNRPARRRLHRRRSPSGSKRSAAGYGLYLSRQEHAAADTATSLRDQRADAFCKLLVICHAPILGVRRRRSQFVRTSAEHRTYLRVPRCPFESAVLACRQGLEGLEGTGCHTRSTLVMKGSGVRIRGSASRFAGI